MQVTGIDIYASLLSELPFAITPEASARFRDLFLYNRLADGRLVVDVLPLTEFRSAVKDLSGKLSQEGPHWAERLGGRHMDAEDAENFYGSLVSGTIFCPPV